MAHLQVEVVLRDERDETQLQKARHRRLRLARHHRWHDERVEEQRARRAPQPRAEHDEVEKTAQVFEHNDGKSSS